MCRMVIFSGLCIRCGISYTVPELAQSVSCLEAKNNGCFGDCHKGVNYDQHDPAIECGPCSSAMGIIDGGNSDELLPAGSSGSTSSRSSSGRGGGSSYDTSKRRRVR